MLELALTLACNHPCYESRTLEQKGRTKTWLYVLLFFVLALLQTLPLFFSLLYCFYKSGYMLKLVIQDQQDTQKNECKIISEHFCISAAQTHLDVHFFTSLSTWRLNSSHGDTFRSLICQVSNAMWKSAWSNIRLANENFAFTVLL